MKYNDNGEWKDIIVKATDTLPIGTEVDYNGTNIPDGWEEVEDTVTKTLKAVYPIGSIYINTTSANPRDIFGFGTWEKIDDVFLFGTSDAAQLGNTGGSATHTHTTGNHTLTGPESGIRAHYHSGMHWGIGGRQFGVNGSNRGNGWWNFEYVNAGHDAGKGSENNFYTGTTGDTSATSPHNHGNTGTTNHMPPYLTVFMWKRTA